MRILLVEDDAEAAAYAAKGLREAGHVVDHALDGEAGLNMAAAGGYDAYVIDRMLPKLDGLSLLAKRREEEDATPALFLSALGEVDDRVSCLKAGGRVRTPYGRSRRPEERSRAGVVFCP